jgi:hypothetical protein
MALLALVRKVVVLGHNLIRVAEHFTDRFK